MRCLTYSHAMFVGINFVLETFLLPAGVFLDVILFMLVIQCGWSCKQWCPPKGHSQLR